MDISNAYKQHQQVLNTQEEIAEVNQELKVVGWAYKLAFIGTYTVYFVFIWMMYVSDMWGFSTWLTHNQSEVFAMIVYMVLAVTLPLAMALIKEIGYQHFAKYPNPLSLIISVVGILALAGVVYEAISSSSQQQHISHNNAENSKTFNAISSTGNGSSAVAASSLSSLIAGAQQKVARCEENLKAGKEKHCKGDKAKLQGYLDSEKRAFEAAERAGVAALETKTKAIKDLKEESYKPVYKAIRDGLDVTIAVAVMSVMVFVAVIFEISHLLLILFQSQKLRRLEGLKQSLINLEAAYMQLTGKAFKSEDFKDDSILNMDEMREHSPAPIGFGQPAVAQFKYQQSEPETKQPMGFTPWTNEKPTPKKEHGQSTWNRELSKSGIDSPDDPIMNQQADRVQIDRILAAGRGTVPTVPEQSESTVYTVVEQPEQPKAEQSEYANDDGLYQAWKKAVIEAQIGTTARGCKQVVEADKDTKISMREAYPIWNVWGERGLNEGFLSINPDHTPKNRKPKYLLAEKYRKGVLGTQEQQLNIV